MALAIDSSTPAIAQADNTCTTASFTAPDSSLLVALCMCNSGSGSTNSVSNSGTALTWTQWVNHQAGEDSGAFNATVKIFTAPAATSAARTVTLTTSGSGYTALKVLVFTGADLNAPVGATGEGHSSTAAITPNVYTSTVANSRCVGIGSDSTSFNSPTTTDVGFTYSNIFPQMSGLAAYKSSDTATAGSTVTLNFDGTGNSRTWNWVAAEILPLVPPLPRPGLMLGQAINRAAYY
ncbi:hypothetical protein [Nonomuraea sediminis]|uniref:hypothetical protein n=1 Tax=Nonomuraea sediminis TaxID=2835864 RepID=UPI001BDDBE76|nr:hypothetical protein [Nonomuraea sediminis]